MHSSGPIVSQQNLVRSRRFQNKKILELEDVSLWLFGTWREEMRIAWTSIAWNEEGLGLDVMGRVYLDSRQDNATVENAASDIIKLRSLGREIESYFRTAA